MIHHTVIAALEAARQSGKGFDLAPSTVGMLLDEIEDARIVAVTDAKDRIEAMVLPSVMAEAKTFRDQGVKAAALAIELCDKTLAAADAVLAGYDGARRLVIPAALVCFALGFQLAQVLS